MAYDTRSGPDPRFKIPADAGCGDITEFREALLIEGLTVSL